VKKFDNLVTIQGSITLEALFTCGRCLEEFSRSIALDMDIRLTPKARMPQASEFELKGEDMDVYYYDSDEIDLDPFIYEEVLLICRSGPFARRIVRDSVGYAVKIEILKPAIVMKHLEPFRGKN